MKHDNRDAIDFANEPVGRLFRRMIAPTLVSMVSMVILTLQMVPSSDMVQVAMLWLQ